MYVHITDLIDNNRTHNHVNHNRTGCVVLLAEECAGGPTIRRCWSVKTLVTSVKIILQCCYCCLQHFCVLVPIILCLVSRVLAMCLVLRQVTEKVCQVALQSNQLYSWSAKSNPFLLFSTFLFALLQLVVLYAYTSTYMPTHSGVELLPQVLSCCRSRAVQLATDLLLNN